MKKPVFLFIISLMVPLAFIVAALIVGIKPYQPILLIISWLQGWLIIAYCEYLDKTTQRRRTP